ncbi:MAG: hypothetical protein AB8G99_17945 [Planctomycetaceae bacterium]
MTTGFAKLGFRGKSQGTVNQQVHDGDTITTLADGNIPVRLLGIDTPEVSFQMPPTDRFVSLKDARWGELLGDPFNTKWGEFSTPVPPGLKAWLTSRTGKHAATIHLEHAQKATLKLREMVTADMKVMGTTDETFTFYMVFGHEVMDGYGRFLCAINRNQPDRDKPTPRPPTYNQRLLERGLAFPYFIWPNINPWQLSDSVMEAVIKPGTAAKSMADNREITFARDNVGKARERHLGLFDATDPALLEPFELRAIARRTLPSRCLIDLSKNDDVLIHPHNYYTVPHPEDRLFIPRHFVPLFVEQGWKKQAAPA